MNSKPKQISFLEFLIDENASQDDSLGEVIFPKGFEVRDLENLRKEFEILANRYGLSLPAKLKKGNLVLEWKPLPGEIQNNTEHINEVRFVTLQHTISTKLFVYIYIYLVN